ncbi:hypothetical protein AXF42_Ash017033 [Apostasia shenzhenica]|uniref:Uncharacterized protein n=1 Tax=Apostasia shenzhenica TaxID=1088818 RepID=A0A2I0B7J1_9ASPA|nr:hypothetical protein AXF42_Ash017033 [Apostasia shenzhenica]
MEAPHNGVLLLCSSHDKGCLPYMCDTSYNHSNCLDLFKKAYTESISTSHVKSQCPLCRGQVKGWTVVEPAREYLNNKRRSCMQDYCSFKGTYSELQKHFKEEHPFAKPPQEVDPLLEKKWRDFVTERDRQDAISLIMSSMPNALILGDYVIDRDHFNGIYNHDRRVYGFFDGAQHDGAADHLLRLRRLRSLRRRRSKIIGRWRWLFGPMRSSFARFAWY